MRKKSFRILSFVLSLILFFVSINIGFTVKADEPESSVYINSEETQAIYTYEGYTVTFTLNGSWEGGHNVGIKIDNTGTENIEDWTLESDYSYVISDIWNASVIENSEGICKIYHNEWNSVIYPGACVEFGFASQEDFVSFPSYYTILGRDIKETDAEQYSIDYAVTDDWGEGYTGTVTITNNSEKPINNWVLDFSCNNDNISVWNAYITSHEGTRISVKNGGFNSIINPGESVSFGFEIYNLTNRDEFYDYSLRESVESLNNGYHNNKEPLIVVGENYIKEPSEEDLVYIPNSDIAYVKNQLIIDAYTGTPKEAVEEIVSYVDAQIVGYIEVINDYQIEFNSNKSYYELETISKYIESFSCIKMVILNYTTEEDILYYPNDAYYNDQKTFELIDYNSSITNETYQYTRFNKINEKSNETWEEENVYCDNWNLNILHIPAAWDLLSNTTTVKIGIYDNYFEDDRNDGELVFDDVIGNNPQFNPRNHDLDHGTHVAGIIGATANNNIGVAGIANDVRLYGYSYMKGLKPNTFFREASGYTKLVTNNVKVINVSYGYTDGCKVCSISEKGTDYSDYKKAVSYVESALSGLVNSGYDFLIVSASGNTNNQYYKKTSDGKYIVDNEKNPSNLKNDMQAKYGSVLNGIEDQRIKDRIIVVGAIDRQMDYFNHGNVGERIDVCAPGVEVLSTIPIKMDFEEVKDEAIVGYGLMSGSSMAAPHITGIAALMLEANPSLSSIQIKRIICDNKYAVGKVHDVMGFWHNIPDAKLCVKAAQETNTTINDWIGGTITGSVKDNSNNYVRANISAVRKNTGDYVLATYNYIFLANEKGIFSNTLPSGTYDLIISADGYLPVIINDFEIQPEKTNYLNVSMVKWKKGAFLSGWTKGEIKDAITGKAVTDAKIRVRKGWNNYSGDYISDDSGYEVQAFSNSYGFFEIILPVGNYTIEIIKDNYIVGYFNTVSTRNNIESSDITYSLSPVLPENEYRIVLTWDGSPRDLDSHLTYYNSGNLQFHVFYGHRSGYYNDVEIASLDLDDTDGYGPETVTITVNADMGGEFRYSVHNFSNETPISKSNAVVRVYKGNTLVQKAIYAPIDATENVWYVFNLTQGEINLKNEYYNSGASNVQ